MTIHVTAATILQQDDRFLVVKERTPSRAGKQVINQPAGHVEKGESFIEAAIRETLEETGWRCAISHCVGVYHYLSPVSQTQYLRVCFAGNLVVQAHPGPIDKNIISTEWMTVAELKKLQAPIELRSPIVLTCIEDYLNKQSLPWACLKEAGMNSPVTTVPLASSS